MSIKLDKQEPLRTGHFLGRVGKMPALNCFQETGFKLDVDPLHLKIWFKLKEYFCCNTNEELLVRLLNIAQEYITRISQETQSTQNTELQLEPSDYQSCGSSPLKESTLNKSQPADNSTLECNNTNQDNYKVSQQFALKESNIDEKPQGTCRYCDKDHSFQKCPLNSPEHCIIDSVDIDAWNDMNQDNNEEFASLSLPSCLQFCDSKNGGVLSKISIKPLTKFGPLVGKRIQEVDISDDCDMKHIWELQSETGNIYISTEDSQCSNWLRFIRPAPCRDERNLTVVIVADSLFLISIKDVKAGEELLYWQDTFDSSNKKKAEKKVEKTVCGGCNMTFEHPLYYRVHCSIFHDMRYSLAIRKYHCKVCGAAILGKENIRKHAAELHNGKGAYQCQYCKKFFLRLNYLEMHRTYGCSSNPLRSKSLCDFCGRKFCQPQKLKIHIKRMHSNSLEVLKDFQCRKCLKILGSRVALRRHLKEVHEKQPDRNYLCSNCGKHFQNKSNLKIHMLTHSGIKPFKCTVDGCAAAFTTKQCLQSHYRKIHSFDEKTMPKIERSVSYTFQAYSGSSAPGQAEEADKKENVEENTANSDIFDDLQSPSGDATDKPASPVLLSPSQTLHTIDHITRETSTPKMISKGSKKWLGDDILSEPIKNFPTFGTAAPKTLEDHHLHKYTSISEFSRRETSNASLLVEAALDSVCNETSLDIDVEVSHNCSDTLVNNIYNLSENSGLPEVAYNIQESQDINLISPSVNDHISVTDDLDAGYAGLDSADHRIRPVSPDKELNLSHRFAREQIPESDTFPANSPRRYDFVENINPDHLSSDDSCAGLPLESSRPNLKHSENEQDASLHRKSSFRMYDYFKRLRFDEPMSSHFNPTESEVPEIPGHLVENKEDKDKYEQDTAADMRNKFDLDLDFRVRHYENNLDSELNRQRPSYMCSNKTSDVLNMSSDNRDLVDFRTDRHFESLDLNSDLQGLDMSTRGFHNYSSNINRYHHVYPELDRMELRLNYTPPPPPYDLVRVVSLDLTPPGRHSVDLSLRSLPLHQISNPRLLSEHSLTNKHRIFDQARLLAGDLSTRMNDNRLLSDTNSRLLPDALTSDRILGGTGTDQLSDEPRLLSDHPRIIDPHLLQSAGVPAAPALSAFGGYTGVTQPAYHGTTMDPRNHVTSPVNGGYHHPYSTYYP